MSPAQYIARHEFRAYLRAKGIRPAMLNSVRLIPLDAAFCTWPLLSPVAWPPGIEEEKRVWASIRWLALEDPPQSHHTAAAWDLISSYYVRYFDQQRRTLGRVERAAHSRKLIGDATLNRVRDAYIRELSGNPPKTRLGAATVLAPIVGISHPRTLDALRKLGLPEKRELRASFVQRSPSQR